MVKLFLVASETPLNLTLTDIGGIMSLDVSLYIKSDEHTEQNKIYFSTGKVIYANNGIVGISPDMEIFEGYDGSISDDYELSRMEKIELADLMIDRWSLFRDQSF